MSPVEPLSPAGVPAQSTGGTPAPLPAEDSAEALETLEFAAVIERVAAHAVGPLGARRISSRWPTGDVDWIRHELARTGEVAALLRRGDTLLAEPIPDVTAAVGRLRIEGSVLEGAELAGLQRVLVASRLVHAELRRIADAAPLTFGLARPLPDKVIERRLELSIDPDGNLLDSASSQLAAARREVQAARQRLLRRLDALLRSLDAGTAAPEGSVTVRGGRYVIPVRRDSRSRPAGIVHDESGSAGTLFIEPSETIELGNALREAQVEEERETLRVLRALTDLLRPELPLLRDAVEMCVAVDDLVARARYAVSSEGEVPDIAAAPSSLRIVNGRHPLLLGASEPVVPFDLDLPEQERTLLISGPNTGGKTVLLKAVGLAAALVASGIVPPLGPGSRLPVFRKFYADIGDRQSIAASLSTFSAHVRMLRQLLEEADNTTLVLLDEIGSGTDPAEGAALAAAALASLTQRGSVSLATTHLGSLKELAAHSPGIVNASLQFDTVTLTPTYRFLKGLPGRSYGLAIARRLGVAAEILADAESRVPDAERSLDSLLAAVEERERELRSGQAELAQRTLELESLSGRLSLQNEVQTARETELRRKEKEAERYGRQQARAFLLEARQRVEEALATARGAADEAASREARRLVEEGVREAGEALAGSGTAGQRDGATDAGLLRVGARVRLESGGGGEVVEVRSDGKVVVAAGSIRMVADRASLTVVAYREERKTPGFADPLSRGPAVPLEIDLRGMTGDEAEVATIAAVDAAVLAEHPYLRIIHGMGTGVVRDRVQRVVSKDRRVSRYAFAPRNQGGTGVTVVEFSA